MKATNNMEKLKELIETNKGEIDKAKLLEYGSTALLFLSGMGGSKLIRTLVICAAVVTAGKLAYDYLAEKAEEADVA